MLQFAGAVADGVIVLAGVAKEALDSALANVELGARSAGRRLEDLDIVTGVFCHVSDDWRRAMNSRSRTRRCTSPGIRTSCAHSGFPSPR
jgi:alkanesulfonate monooxygenase SsuD/methylene tetrahydromethanopterin reductase-like flavin-dependent oxidoreductase (luciferase family)